MTQVPLAPPPQTGQPIDGWLFLLWKRLTSTGQILWSGLSFTGSNLTDIETRNHADLQNIDTASYTHLTATQATDLTDGGTTTLHTHPSGVASSVTVADAASDTTTFLVLSGAATGDQALLTDAGLSYDAATNILTVTGSVSAALNGTVGATTPAAGAFTTLSATGVTTVQAGTALLPAITPSGDPNTGIWFVAADTVSVSTAGVERMRVNATGSISIGATTANQVSLYTTREITGATTSYNRLTSCLINPSVTTAAYGDLSSIGTAANGGTPYTITTIIHNSVNQGTLHADSTVTNQYAYQAGANLIGATNNYGFLSQIPVGTGRWNFYAAGSANNAYAGNSSFGQVVAPIAAVDTTSFATNLVTNTGATYTVLTTDHTIIQTTAASVYTLPAASSFTGRILHLVTQFAGTVTSASSNVVPIAGGAAGTAILAATAGKFATLQSDGTNWIIIASN